MLGGRICVFLLRKEGSLLSFEVFQVELVTNYNLKKIFFDSLIYFQDNISMRRRYIIFIISIFHFLSKVFYTIPYVYKVIRKGCVEFEKWKFGDSVRYVYRCST